MSATPRRLNVSINEARSATLRVHPSSLAISTAPTPAPGSAAKCDTVRGAMMNEAKPEPQPQPQPQPQPTPKPGGGWYALSHTYATTEALYRPAW